MVDSKRNFILKIATVATVLFILGVLLLLWINAGKSTVPPSPKKSADVFPETFSFYHLSANTRLSDSFTQKFEKMLGTHAITRKTTLELGIRKNTILSTRFPSLHQLDQKLNGKSNERVEHDTILLTFRYPPEETKFFQYVKLWFSNHNSKPLMVEIKTDKDGRFLVDNIKKKYGSGENVDLKSDVEDLSYWEQEHDYLMVNTAPDRYGNDTFTIKIYYANNLEALFSKEQANQKSPANDLKNSSEPVFF